MKKREASFAESPMRVEGFSRQPQVGDFESTLKEQDYKLQQVRFGGKTPAEVDAANTHVDEKLFFQQRVHQSKILDSDPLFRFLKGKLVDLSLQESKGVTTMISRNFSRTLSSAMRKLIREVVLTKDRTMQKTYLSRVYQWVQSKLEEKEGLADRAQSPSPGKRETVKLPSLTELNRDYVLPQVLSYSKDAGSSLPYNPPDTSFQSSGGAADLSTTVASPDRSKLRSSQFSRLSPTSFQTRQIYTSQRPRALNQVRAISKASLPSTVRKESQASHSPDRTLPPTLQRLPVAPVEARSIYVHYQPVDNAVEQKLEQAWYLKKNAQVAEKRAIEEERRVVAEWGQSRARMEEEIARRIERQFFGANMQSDAFVWKDPSAQSAKEKTMLDYQQAYNHVSSDQETSISGGSTDNESPKASPRPQRPPPPPMKKEIYDLTLHENGGGEAGQQQDSEDEGVGKKRVSRSTPAPPTATTLPKLPETSLMEKIVMEAKKRKIEQLRRFQGGLIKANRASNLDDINNIFVSSTNPKEVITLSLYNRAGYYLNRRQDYRPQTGVLSETTTQPLLGASFNLGGGEGADMNRSELLGDEAEMYREAANLRNIKGLSGDLGGAKSRNHEYRMQQLGEILRVKERLAKEDINCPITALQRAILLPEEKKNERCYVQGKEGDDKEYMVAPSENLIVNPFKKVTKGKKKKGKKGKKK